MEEKNEKQKIPLPTKKEILDELSKRAIRTFIVCVVFALLFLLYYFLIKYF
jgi:hypothetical protein